MPGNELLIVGNGPSILGARVNPDDYDVVVRCKSNSIPEGKTTYNCEKGSDLDVRAIRNRWPWHCKPSVGLCAVWAMYEMGHRKVSLVGFDSHHGDHRRFNRDVRIAHDFKAEKEEIHRLMDVTYVD